MTLINSINNFTLLPYDILLYTLPFHTQHPTTHPTLHTQKTYTNHTHYIYTQHSLPIHIHAISTLQHNTPPHPTPLHIHSMQREVCGAIETVVCIPIREYSQNGPGGFVTSVVSTRMYVCVSACVLVCLCICLSFFLSEKRIFI